ncbi:hypothetical protein QQ045_003255 [Rhodiola kirilowii]
MVQQGKVDKVAEKDDYYDAKSIIVLSSPLALDGDYSISSNGGAPNLMQRVFSLFKSVRPGTDLTSFQLPPQFNIPKSQLQCYGEGIYCVGNDLLHQCSSGKTPLDRIASVIAWSISTARPLMFGFAPYNPILGETHHGSRGTLNVLVEQVSHHPPVSALHATDEKANVEVIICEHQVPKFYGTSIEVEAKGTWILNLLNHAESYVLNSPKLSIKFLPVPLVEWVGTIRVQCADSGLEAEFTFKGSSIFSRKQNQKMIKGRIFESSSLKTIFEINGHWDRTVSIKNVRDGTEKIIYNATESMSGLKSPIIQHPKEVLKTESARVWGEVSQGIKSKEWEKAREGKKNIEEKERELAKERERKGETWSPKHFTVTYSKEKGWECSPQQKWVPSAPIVYPTQISTQ